MIDWDDFPNFGKREFACRETGECEMKEEALVVFQDLRTSYNRPLTVSSGFRSISHPIEAAKIDRGGRPGTHNSGLAADFQVAGEDASELVRLAPNDPRVTGNAILQQGHGDKRVLHLDVCPAGEGGSPRRPAIWSY